MEITDAETETLGGTESAVGSVHADRGRCEGVIRWENQGTPVLTAFVGSIGSAGEEVMPF